MLLKDLNLWHGCDDPLIKVIHVVNMYLSYEINEYPNINITLYPYKSYAYNKENPVNAN